MSSANALALIIGGVILGLFTGSNLAYLWWVRGEQGQAMSWPATECTVLASQVQVSYSTDQPNTFSLELSYRYEVGGREYVGDRYDAAGNIMDGYDHAHAAAASLPAGARVTCYYDPANPERAVISRKARETGFGWIYSGVLFLVAMAALGVGLFYRLAR